MSALKSILFLCLSNKPENQDEDALGKIEQQQNCVILERWPQLKWASTSKAKYLLNLNFEGLIST